MLWAASHGWLCVYVTSPAIAKNIAYGKDNATMEEIMAAAKDANAHDFIMGFPGGLVGWEGGSWLSAGSGACRCANGRGGL